MMPHLISIEEGRHMGMAVWNRYTCSCPVIVNTSFNVRGEPIVCSPEDAFCCFMGTELDVLIVGNSILHKAEQSQELAADYKLEYELD